MVAVVASHHDRAASRFVERWAGRGAILLTVSDLSTAGWRLTGGAPQTSTAVIGGRIVAARELSGVLTRRPVVFEQELAHIAPEDRAYVAAEMTAFLCAWLAELTCPVLNRPSPACLAGPNWRRERWAHTVERLGIPVQPVRRQVGLPAQQGPPPALLARVTVTVVGNRCIGDVDDALAQAARRLAAAARVELLAVHWSGADRGARFVGADLWPDVASPPIAEAVYDYLSGGATR